MGLLDRNQLAQAIRERDRAKQEADQYKDFSERIADDIADAFKPEPAKPQPTRPRPKKKRRHDRER